MVNNQMTKQTKHGWVDLSNLPMRGKTINWKRSVGSYIRFQYQDEIHILHVLEYKSSHCIYVDLDDSGEKILITTDNILRGKFAGILGKRVNEFRYSIGDLINNLLITNRYYKKGKKTYDYVCLIDGYCSDILESNLHRGVSCPACNNKVIIKGINDIATTNQMVANLFYNKEDAFKYSEHSGKKAYFQCPRCGEIILAYIDDVVKRGLSCRKCGDNISYPEKFVFNLLQQVACLHSDDVSIGDFETQKIFDWSKDIFNSNEKLSGNKKYDFYVPTKNGIIIEAHGPQHFAKCLYNSYKNSRTLEEEKENDYIKMDLAIFNGVLPSHYIQLDCRRSEIDYIKSSIMSSNLPNLLNFTEDQIDWEECGRFATSSRIFEACELWNSGIHSTTKIGKQMKIHQTTILRYLRRGEGLGIITDPPRRRNMNLTIQN